MIVVTVMSKTGAARKVSCLALNSTLNGALNCQKINFKEDSVPFLQPAEEGSLFERSMSRKYRHSDYEVQAINLKPTTRELNKGLLCSLKNEHNPITHSVRLLVTYWVTYGKYQRCEFLNCSHGRSWHWWLYLTCLRQSVRSALPLVHGIPPITCNSSMLAIRPPLHSLLLLSLVV